MSRPPCPEIDAAIDAYLAAERDALDVSSLAAFGPAQADALQARRRAERRLIDALRGRGEAYIRRGSRWCLDPFGDLVRVPDDGILQRSKAGDTRGYRYHNNRSKL